jgi:predicted Zn-dependent peptidase
LVVAGNIVAEQVYELSEKWFGDIPSGIKYERNIPQEEPQLAAKRMDITADVPVDAFLKTWHMPSRMDPRYYAADLITDILGSGASSRLFQAMVKEQQLFTNIDCYHYGSTDAGLICIDGKLVKGVSPEQAEAAVNALLENLKTNGISVAELEKVKNKTESTMAFEDMSVMNRAASLAYYELLGDADLMNTELGKYHDVTAAEIQAECRLIFDEKNSHTLYYRAAKAKETE